MHHWTAAEERTRALVDGLDGLDGLLFAWGLFVVLPFELELPVRARASLFELELSAER